MAKKKAEIAKNEKKTYKSLVGLANDKTGKRYNAGDTITPADFSANTIKEFLTIGAIVEVS